MDIDKFWKMIGAAREAAQGDLYKQRDLLVERLSEESEEAIIEFDKILHDIQDKADRASIWEVGYFIHCIGGSNVDKDFRSWLIAQGKEIFEKALENPDSLAAVVDAEHRLDVEFEMFGYVGAHAYLRKTGQEIWDVPRPSRQKAQVIEYGVIHDEEEWPKLFPELVAKLGTCEEWYAQRKYDAVTQDDETETDSFL